MLSELLGKYQDAGFQGALKQASLIWQFPKIRGTLFWGP